MPNTTFSVTIEKLPELTQALSNYPTIARPVLQSAIVAAQAVLAKYTTSATVPVLTGYLLQNWGFDIGNLQARWYPKAAYAPYVEFGTGIYGPKGEPITIRAKDKKALYWPGAAHPVQSVTIKGQKPNPFLERIIAAAQPDIDALFLGALEKITTQIAIQST